MIKRSFRVLKLPRLPSKRPFAFNEIKFLREKFGDEYRWSEIDADGNIILIKKDAKGDMGMLYITEEDLKKELELRRSIGIK